MQDASPTRFCASVDAAFCWSFDEKPYELGPQLQPLPGGGFATTMDARSPPYALSVTYAGAASEAHGVELDDAFDASHGMRCEADMRVDQAAPYDAAGVDTFYLTAFAAGDDLGYVTLAFKPILDASALSVALGSFVYDGGYTSAAVSTIAFDRTWAHVVLELDGANVSASIGGSVFATVAQVAPRYVRSTVFTANCAQGACAISFDNLVCGPR